MNPKKLVLTFLLFSGIALSLFDDSSTDKLTCLQVEKPLELDLEHRYSLEINGFDYDILEIDLTNFYRKNVQKLIIQLRRIWNNPSNNIPHKISGFEEIKFDLIKIHEKQHLLLDFLMISVTHIQLHFDLVSNRHMLVFPPSLNHLLFHFNTLLADEEIYIWNNRITVPQFRFLKQYWGFLRREVEQINMELKFIVRKSMLDFFLDDTTKIMKCKTVQLIIVKLRLSNSLLDHSVRLALINDSPRNRMNFYFVLASRITDLHSPDGPNNFAPRQLSPDTRKSGTHRRAITRLGISEETISFSKHEGFNLLVQLNPKFPLFLEENDNDDSLELLERPSKNDCETKYQNYLRADIVAFSSIILKIEEQAVLSQVDQKTRHLLDKLNDRNQLRDFQGLWIEYCQIMQINYLETAFENPQNLITLSKDPFGFLMLVKFYFFEYFSEKCTVHNFDIHKFKELIYSFTFDILDFKISDSKF